MPDSPAIIAEVLTDVLERFAFMFMDPLDKAEWPADPAEAFEEVTIEFTGPQRGGLALVAGREFGLSLAANVLGREKNEVQPELVPDAIKELVNVICGEYLERLAGKRVVFHLTIPRISVINASQAREFVERPETLCLSIDGHPAAFHAWHHKAP